MAEEDEKLDILRGQRNEFSSRCYQCRRAGALIPPGWPGWREHPCAAGQVQEEQAVSRHQFNGSRYTVFPRLVHLDALACPGELHLQPHRVYDEVVGRALVFPGHLFCCTCRRLCSLHEAAATCALSRRVTLSSARRVFKFMVLQHFLTGILLHELSHLRLVLVPDPVHLVGFPQI